jgi:hypothetical protein
MDGTVELLRAFHQPVKLPQDTDDRQLPFSTLMSYQVLTSLSFVTALATVLLTSVSLSGK